MKPKEFIALRTITNTATGFKVLEGEIGPVSKFPMTALKHLASLNPPRIEFIKPDKSDDEEEIEPEESDGEPGEE